MISQAQLARVRQWGADTLASVFRTIIAIGDTGDRIAAARWSLATSADSELAGLLPAADIAFRVSRDLIADSPLAEGRTIITEGVRRFRLQRIRDAAGDPGLVLECKAI